jgi:uncharacterized protein
MTKTITISMPVADLPASLAFYAALGFEIDHTFSGETAARMVWSDTISVMLLTHDVWRSLTERPIPPRGSSAVGLIISCDSRAAVDAMNATAAAHGGTADINPIEDHGFMYTRDFADPDGQIWGAMWMDPAAMASA